MVTAPDSTQQSVIQHPAIHDASPTKASLSTGFTCCSGRSSCVPAKPASDPLRSIKVLGHCEAWPDGAFPEDSIPVIRSSTPVAGADSSSVDTTPALIGCVVVLDVYSQSTFYLRCSTAYLIGCDCRADGRWSCPARNADWEQMARCIRSQWIPNDMVVAEVCHRHGRRTWNLIVGGSLGLSARTDCGEPLGVTALPQ